MNTSVYLITAILSLAPISELRGAIPYALAKGMPIVLTYFYCIFFNFLASIITYTFLKTLHKFFYKFNCYKNFFDHFIEKARKKVGKEVEKYGGLGLAVFVAIPLPVTGAITATIGGWVLGIKKKVIFPAVLAGVAIAGIIVTLISYFGIEAFSFFTKEI